jgi:GntR family transcriptional regulator/MocR family aminotransferase
MSRRPGGFLPGVRVNRTAGTPLYQQIASAISTAIDGGHLYADERIPSTRALAARLGVSRNTVLAAFDELAAAGLVEGRRGGGMYVAARSARPRIRGRAVAGADPDGNAFLVFF